MMKVLGYGLVSSAGHGVTPFFKGLLEGVDHSKNVSTKNWPSVARNYWAQQDNINLKACLWHESHKRSSFTSINDLAVLQLLSAFKEALSMSNLSTGSLKDLGVIVTSTKGSIEDIVWDLGENAPFHSLQDSLYPVLTQFCNKADINPKRSICLSNACSSTHAALFLAKNWLTNGLVKKIVIIAVDLVGPFVLLGFSALRSLTKTKVRSFSKERDGLRLGEAAAAIILEEDQKNNECGLTITNVAIESEGHSVTRPTDDGKALKQACINALDNNFVTPDLIIAHGTGTQRNDAVEDQVFSELFTFSCSKGPLITGTKWSVGHTLGPSGAVDLIAACEVLKTGKVFNLGNTFNIDKKFKCDYLTCDKASSDLLVQQVLVTSLGFGGFQAAFILKKGENFDG